MPKKKISEHIIQYQRNQRADLDNFTPFTILLSLIPHFIVPIPTTRLFKKALMYISDCVEVIFQNIADESKIIEELYVVEVVVKSWTNDILFSTSKGEVYIKTEGGKKKLDAYGIQEELRGRLNGF